MTHTIPMFKQSLTPTHRLRANILSERWSTFFDFADKNACGKEQMERYFGMFYNILKFANFMSLTLCPL